MQRVALRIFVSTACLAVALEDAGSLSTFLAPEAAVSVQADWLGVEQPTQTQKNQGLVLAEEVEHSLRASAQDLSKVRISHATNMTTKGFLRPGQILEASLGEKGAPVKVVLIRVVYNHYYVQTIPGDWTEGVAHALPDDEKTVAKFPIPKVDTVEFVDFKDPTCAGDPFYLWQVKTVHPNQCQPIEQLLPRGVMHDPTQRTLVLKDSNDAKKEPQEYGFGMASCKNVGENTGISLCKDPECKPESCTGEYADWLDKEQNPTTVKSWKEHTKEHANCKVQEPQQSNSPGGPGRQVPIGIGSAKEESEKFYPANAAGSRWTCVLENEEDKETFWWSIQTWPREFYVAEPRELMKTLPQETYEGPPSKVFCGSENPRYCAYPNFDDIPKNYFSPWHDVPMSPTKADVKQDASGKNDDSNSFFHWICLMPKGSTAKMQVSKELRYNPIVNVVTAKGLQGEYEHESSKGLLYNVGIIPQTWMDPMDGNNEDVHAGNNEPIEVIQMNDHKCVPGNIEVVRVLGGFRLQQKTTANSWQSFLKVVAVRAGVAQHLEQSQWKDMGNIPQEKIDELRQWYKLQEKEAQNIEFEMSENAKEIPRSKVIETIHKAHLSWEWLQNASKHEKAKSPEDLNQAKVEMKKFTNRLESVVLDSQAIEEYKDGMFPKIDDAFKERRLKNTCETLSFAFKGGFQTGPDGAVKEYDCQRTSMTLGEFKGFFPEEREGVRAAQFLIHVYMKACKDEVKDFKGLLALDNGANLKVEDLHADVIGACNQFHCKDGVNQPIPGVAGGQVTEEGLPVDNGVASGSAGGTEGGGKKEAKEDKSSAMRSVEVRLLFASILYALS